MDEPALSAEPGQRGAKFSQQSQHSQQISFSRLKFRHAFRFHLARGRRLSSLVFFTLLTAEVALC